ncbi:hypothetical protein ACFLXB_08045 [Chloroflexota bacterium]
MRRIHTSSQVKYLTITMLIPSLFLISLILGLARPVSASQTLPNTPVLTDEDEGCLACHGKPGFARDFPNGDLWDLTVDTDHFLGSVHANEGITCTSCHTDIHFYPHAEFQASSEREVSLQLNPLCKNCHIEQHNNTMDSIHQTQLETGNSNAALCVDCHNPHVDGRITDPISGEVLPEILAAIPQTCAKCHNGIFEAYRASVHGEALLEGNSQDTATCTSCHGSHNISDTDTNEFRTNSPLLCANCHTDATIMDKYGLSTNVLDTYVADFHGTTITLFEKTDPSQPSNKPVCYDCHGIHDIKRTSDPQHGIQIKENLLIKCQNCHPDATANFPNSWMSHYIPSPAKYPIVYYINLFYKFFIPIVLGSMGVYVLLDFVHRIVVRIKGAVRK